MAVAPLSYESANGSETTCDNVNVVTCIATLLFLTQLMSLHCPK